MPVGGAFLLRKRRLLTRFLNRWKRPRAAAASALALSRLLTFSSTAKGLRWGELKIMRDWVANEVLTADLETMTIKPAYRRK